MTQFILAIDQGTTSSRAVVFDDKATARGMGQFEFSQHFPKSGWVEHDGYEIWQTTLDACKLALVAAKISARDIATIGITNQRETTLVWDKATSELIYPAIVWQDRRTTQICDQLKAQGLEPFFKGKTGLLLDPYFSGTKIAWILDNISGARSRAERGELAFGTIDTWLLWKLTNGAIHATDATNASRTLLYDIDNGQWDEELAKLLNVPLAILPKVGDCSGNYGVTDETIFGTAIAITGIAGDQQAASFGQACFVPGMMKATYGTGCFALLNTGSERVTSNNRLLSTIGYQLDGQVSYALEGSIFIAGAAVQWLRDGLGIVENAAETAMMAMQADDQQEVYLVPAFTGLGAPYWDAHCRGALYGLTRNTGPNELARAALEAVCYQTGDLLTAMQDDWHNYSQTSLRVDGGMAASDWTMQFLADILDVQVDRPRILETTALGAAYLAGLHIGIFADMKSLSRHWQLDQSFKPNMDHKKRKHKKKGWLNAVQRTLVKPH